MNNNEIMNNEVVEATEEVIENEAVAYSTVYEDTEELYEGETETKRSCRRGRLQVCSKAGNCKHQSPDRAEEDGC